MKLTIKKPTQLSSRLPVVHCKGYLPIIEGAVIMLFAGGGVGKSFAAIRECVEFAKETGKRSVLWLTEDPEGENRNRYERIIKEYGSNPRDFFDTKIDFIQDTPVKLTKLQDGNAVLTDEFYSIRLALFDYSMVVLDPLLQFSGGDENNNTHAGVLMGALKDWAAEERKTIFLLHHASVSAHTGRLKPRGAGEWVNGTRGAYEIQVITQESGGTRIVDESQKDNRRFVLTKDNGLSYHFRDMVSGLNERILPVFPPRIETQEEKTKPGYVRFSKADHNDARNAKGFKPMYVPFDALHLHVKENCCYSPYLFSDGHRKNENNLGYADVLCLDFDEGMTLLEAEKKFKGIKCLIVTTRSHRKNGNGDRFRVIIKLKTPLNITPSDHNAMMQVMFDYFGSVDPAVKDMARFFFASPPDAMHFYSGSDNEFDWEPFHKQVMKQKVKEKLDKINSPERQQRQRETPHKKPQNTLPTSTMFRTFGGTSVTFGELRDRMMIGDKEKVQCRHGYGHNGGQGPDRNHSAFVSKVDNGNVFYKCSGGKCAAEGSLFCED